MKCDCKRWATWTFGGKTICSKCGEPAENHMSRFLREQLKEDSQ